MAQDLEMLDMCCSQLAPMRLVPFSYFCTLSEADAERIAERRWAHLHHLS